MTPAAGSFKTSSGVTRNIVLVDSSEIKGLRWMCNFRSVCAFVEYFGNVLNCWGGEMYNM